MIRVPLCLVPYLLAWFLLGSVPVIGAGPSWQAIILIYTATGPLMLLAPRTNFIGKIAWSALFFRAIFVIVLLYPCVTSPAAGIVLLTLFAVECVSLLERHWPASFFFFTFIIVFEMILPRRMHGFPYPAFTAAFFIIASAWIALVAVCSRTLLLREREIAEKKKEIERQKELIDQVYLLNVQFQEYALNAERKSAEEERKRITRDIHDIMGYTLVNLRVMLEVSLDLAGDANEKLSTLLSDAIRHTRDGLQSARKALRNLRAIEDKGEFWMNRLNRTIQTFASVTGVSIRVSWGNVTRANCPRIKSAVYQFVQESLTNAFKHGKATEISIDFTIAGIAPDDRFIARVVDNGAGAKEVVPGIGFAGIRERVEQLEGTSGFRNPETGFEVWVSIPMLSMRKDI